MTTYEIHINMDAKCPSCGKPGQVRIPDDSTPEGYRVGICFSCALKKLTGGRDTTRKRRRRGTP